MQGLQSKARALQQQLEAQGEQLRAETRRADEAVAAAAGGADQEAVAKLRGELEASQAAQRTYREEAAVAKMALERQVKDLERSLEASRQEHARDRDELQTSRRELEEVKARAAKGAGAAALEEELGGVRAQLEQAEERAAEERAAAAAAAAAAAEAQGELAKLTKLTAELTKLTQAQAELEGMPGPASKAVAAASRHAASQVSRPASGVGGNSGAPEPGGGVPPALAQQLVEGLAAAAGAAEAAVAERLATCEARVGAALSQLGRARDEAKRVAGRLRAETRRAEVAEAAAAAAGGGGGEDAIATEARLRAAALAEAEAEARSRDLAIEIAELRRASTEEAAAVAQALREKADEIAELRAAAEARAAADALAAASPFKQWEAAPEASPEPPQGAADAGEAAAALEKLHEDLRRVKRERFWVRCLVVSLSHTVELCKEELEGSQQQASQGAAALQQASDQLLQEKARLEAMADKHTQLQHNLELAAAATAAAPPPPAPEAEAWRSFCAELTPETKLQADSRQLEQGAPGTVWNPDTSLTGCVVWVCPSGDTLELSFLGSSPPVDGISSPVPRASSPLLEQHPSLNPAATAIAAAASAADHAEHDGEYAWVSREASLERRGSLLSLMTAAAPVDGGSSVGAKEQVRALLEPKPSQPATPCMQPATPCTQPATYCIQPATYCIRPATPCIPLRPHAVPHAMQVSALLGASLHGATLVHEGEWSQASNGRRYSVCSQV